MRESTNTSNDNRILSALPDRAYQSLVPYLRRVELERGQVLYEPGEVVRQIYFPTNSIISLLNTTEEGWSVQLALVGEEGMVGLGGLLETKTMPYRAVVQISGGALEMRSDAFSRAFQRHHSLSHHVLAHTHSLVAQISQSAVCNRFHSVEQRLARLLLSLHDRSEVDELPLTHDLISLLLGSRRPSVTISAGALQKAGFINWTRGQVSILNRDALKTVTCECYGIIRSSFG